MLESMSALQLQEWFAFFRIRDEKPGDGGQSKSGGYGASKEEQQRMSGDILRTMQGYQNRRDRLKGIAPISSGR